MSGLLINPKPRPTRPLRQSLPGQTVAFRRGTFLHGRKVDTDQGGSQSTIWRKINLSKEMVKQLRREGEKYAGTEAGEFLKGILTRAHALVTSLDDFIVGAVTPSGQMIELVRSEIGSLWSNWWEKKIAFKLAGGATESDRIQAATELLRESEACGLLLRSGTGRLDRKKMGRDEDGLIRLGVYYEISQTVVQAGNINEFTVLDLCSKIRAHGMRVSYRGHRFSEDQVAKEGEPAVSRSALKDLDAIEEIATKIIERSFSEAKKKIEEEGRAKNLSPSLIGADVERQHQAQMARAYSNLFFNLLGGYRSALTYWYKLPPEGRPVLAQYPKLTMILENYILAIGREMPTIRLRPRFESATVLATGNNALVGFAS
ncbi:MAG: hypothetical protein ABIE84_02580 [bacterium]